MHSDTKTHRSGADPRRMRHCVLLATAMLALAGCNQGGRDPNDIGPSSTARGNTSGGGSTSTGQVSGNTPIGADLPQRETATRTGPGTPNPVNGGTNPPNKGDAVPYGSADTASSVAAAAKAQGAGGNSGRTVNSGGAGGPDAPGPSTNAGNGSAAGGDAQGTSAGGAGGAVVGGSGSPTPASAPGTPHVSASGASTKSAGGIANAPGMAAGPNGRRGTADTSGASQR